MEQFAKRLNTLDRIDALIENAGIAVLEYASLNGIESHPYGKCGCDDALAFRAIPKLKESAKKYNIKPNLVILSSETGLYPSVKGKLDTVDGNLFETLSEPGTSMQNRCDLPLGASALSPTCRRVLLIIISTTPDIRSLNS